MELLTKSDAAALLGVTRDAVEAMIEDGTLFAVRFASGVRVLVDDTERPVDQQKPLRCDDRDEGGAAQGW